MDQRTRKLMAMNKALHPEKMLTNYMYQERRGGRGLASIEDRVDSSIHRLHTKA